MRENMKAYIMQLQHFSVNDGEGIRTTIFMAGCPLRCKWCCNPESWILETNKYVKKMSLEEIIDEINRHTIFYRYSQGGITYSGGEATFQLEFLRKMVNVFYTKGIHQAIETCGCFNWIDAKDIFEILDFIFVDIKHFDSDKHKQLTGVDNYKILDNIKSIGKLNKEVVVRIPLIRNINDDEKNISHTAKFVNDNIPNGKIEILPYHSLGNRKYDILGLASYKNIFEKPSEKEIEKAKNIINSYNVETIEYK